MPLEKKDCTGRHNTDPDMIDNGILVQDLRYQVGLKAGMMVAGQKRRPPGINA